MSGNPIQPESLPLITDDRLIIGILFALLALIFWTASRKGLFPFYKIIPPLFLCYVVPSVLASGGVFSAEHSGVYDMAKNYFLPAALILFTITIDIPSLLKLGPKALIIFLTGTAGIIIGGPLAIWIISFLDPDSVGGEGAQETWRGFATLAGSWIGGSPNQTALLEVYKFDQSMYGGIVAIDIFIANILTAALLIGVGIRHKIDKWLRADTKAIDALIEKVSKFESSVSRKASTTDYVVILGLTFGGVALSHFLADVMSGFFSAKYTVWKSTSENPVPNLDEFILCNQFFWVVLIATFIGFAYSFTSARKLEGAGAGKIGSVMMYFLIATIGMKMDMTNTFDEPMWLLAGFIWIIFHIGLMLLVARLIRAPYFFVAVGSMSNVGGAASAPVVAEAFHRSLMTVGVVLAVLGYFIGTLGGILSAELMALITAI